MKRTRHSTEQIVTKLREADAMLAAGRPVSAVVQALGVSEQTYHRWRDQYGGMKADEAQQAQGARDRERTAEERRGGPDARQPDPQGGQQLPGKTSTPEGRRRVVTHVQETMGVEHPRASERRVCRVLGQALDAAVRQHDQDGRAAAAGRAHARAGASAPARLPHGLRHAALEGWRVNRKRVHRLWKRAKG